MTKRLRVFETFSGIGAQAKALKKAKIEHEIVATSDWFINAILAYDAINCNDIKIDVPSYEDQLNYLKNKKSFFT